MKPTQHSLLSISGESGGGQLLRSALSLSLVTGQAFRMTNIRGKRPKPGLMRQHLTCVTASAEVCGAEVEGATIGSTELMFQPRKIQPGDYRFSIGSGGSTTLVFQTLLPALLQAKAGSTLRIEGGTHNPMAPPFEFIEHCFLPILRRMGVDATATLERPGFMQAGGGVLTATIRPLQTWRPLILTERGGLEEPFGRVLHAHLPGEIAKRAISTAARLLEWPEDRIELRYANDSIGPGSAILLGVRHAHVVEISTGIAQMGKSAEAIAAGAAKGLRGYLASPAPVGVHLADQLVLPMALAGQGLIHTLSITDHIRTNMTLIQQFLPDIAFVIKDLGKGVKEIRVRS